MTLFLSLLAAGAYAVGGLFMRKAEGFAHALPAAVVFGCFGVGAALQILAMRRSELGVNYVLVLGLEAALALLLGIGWLGETLSTRKLAGLALILAGVMSLRLEGTPKPVATEAAGDAHATSTRESAETPIREATSQDAGGSGAPTSGRRPCQNTNHAPCR